MKQVTNSGSFRKNDDFFCFFITSRRYFENNQPQVNSWPFKFSFPLKKKLLLQSIYALATSKRCGVTYLNGEQMRRYTKERV